MVHKSDEVEDVLCSLIHLTSIDVYRHQDQDVGNLTLHQIINELICCTTPRKSAFITGYYLRNLSTYFRGERSSRVL